jgi:hypothetical protein
MRQASVFVTSAMLPEPLDVRNHGGVQRHVIELVLSASGARVARQQMEIEL